MRKKPQLITLRQLEDWLIYHCPLQPTQREVAKLFNAKISDYPFTVTFGHSKLGINFQASDATPWKAYRELAKMLYKDPTALPVMTDLYYQS